MTDRTAAALASALPERVELRPSYPGSDVWYARDIHDHVEASDE
jgi:hypothetical protein